MVEVESLDLFKAHLAQAKVSWSYTGPLLCINCITLYCPLQELHLDLDVEHNVVLVECRPVIW